MGLSKIAGIAAPMFLWSSIASAELVTDGNEFQVNSYTIGQQGGASLAPAPAGGFVAAWTALGGQDGYGNGIFGQRFASGAVRLGSEFQINSYTLDGQGSAAIASDAQGRFVVAWDSYEQDGAPYQGVFAQRFDSDGQPSGSEFQVNSYTLGSQYAPAVAATQAGSFVVAWESYDEVAGQDGSYGGIFAQRYDSGGSPVGSEFLVNTYTEENQFTPAVEFDAGGGFLILWAGSGPEGLRIRARLYDSAGQPAGPQFDANDPTTASLRDPAVARLAGGDFLAAWSHDPASFEEDIHARRFDSGGTALGTEFLVNTFTSGRQVSASVAATSDGGFAVAWQSGGEDGSGLAVMSRLYGAAGDAKGEPTRMNITTMGDQGSPTLIETSPGRMLGAWTGDQQDGSFQGIFAVRLAPFGTVLSGKKLLIKNPAGGPSKNKLVFLSKDTTVAAPSGTAEDPRCAPFGSGTPTAGATLRLVGLGGDVSIDLPCIGWTVNASGSEYSYRDASGNTCKSVKLKNGNQLKAVCKGAQVAYALGAAEGDVSLSLTMGEALHYCATFGTSTLADVRKDGSNGRTYKALDALAPVSCP